MRTGAEAVQVVAFWTTGDSWLSALIRPFSDPTHAGLLFHMDDGSIEYCESLFGEGFRAGKNGDWLFAWANEKPSMRKLVLLPLPILGTAAEMIRQRAKALDGVAGYNTFQLFQLLAFKRWGIAVRPSPRRMICSEAQARLLFPRYDLRSPTRPNFDSLTPQDTLERLRSVTQPQRVHAPMKGGPNESTTTNTATHSNSSFAAPGSCAPGGIQ